MCSFCGTCLWKRVSFSLTHNLLIHSIICQLRPASVIWFYRGIGPKPNATALNQDLLACLCGVPIISIFLSKTVPGATLPQIWAEKFIYMT